MQNLIKQGTQFIFSIVLLGLLAISASALTFTVNSTANTSDASDTDNACDVDLVTAGEQCTLRAAIQQANDSAGADAINFDLTVFASAQTIFISGSRYEQIEGDLTITGTSPALLVIDGTQNYRIFEVSSGVTVSISNLTVANGYSGEASGGGILNSGNLTLTNVVVRDNEVVLGDGGGIFNNLGTLTITNSEIRGNDSTDNGGGIANNNGTLNISRSTISGNSASNGAGIYNLNGGVTLDNSTISGNTAGNIGGGYYGFADISVAANLSASASTIASNVATTGGGIAVSSSVGSSSAYIDNTIVADNAASSGPDIYSPNAIGINNEQLSTKDNASARLGVATAIFSNGYNLIENTSGALFFSTVTDIIGVDPQLLPLANNGGLTQTHALSSTSPAIDKGNRTGTDQRGVQRPIDNPGIPPATGGNNADIGSYEASFVPTAASVTIGGRVVLASGKSIANALVVLIEADGNVRQTMTNFFGYYRFADVAAGQTALIEVRSKRYGFAPQIINVNQEMTELNFSAQP